MPPQNFISPLGSQVTVAFALVAFNSAISQVLQLGVGATLIIAALRCIAQLTIVSFVLRYVSAVESMWAVARLARRFPTVFLKGRVAH